MSQLGMMGALAVMSGVVAAVFIWFSGALLDNLRAIYAHRAASRPATDDDSED